MRSLPVNSRFRVSLETNHYSVPAHWAGTSLTARIYADRLALYHQDQPVAEHVRSYDRHQDFEHPDHAQPLLAQRQKAREQQLLTRFLALCPQAPEYYEQLRAQPAQRPPPRPEDPRPGGNLRPGSGSPAPPRMPTNTRPTVASTSPTLSSSASASCPSRARLHLTRSADLLQLDLPEPDLSVYDPKPPTPRKPLPSHE